MSSPQVLVVMPMYNAKTFVQKAIESILSQTFVNYQFLIVNDGSTDGSPEVVSLFNDPRITIWNQVNSGPGSAMNRAIQYAHDTRIPFIARMDADDISLPSRLEKQISWMQKHPAAVACSCNCCYIDSDSEQIVGTSTVSSSPKLIQWEIFHGLRGLIQGACVFRTEPLYTIDGYRPIFKQAEEVDLFLRLAERFELTNSPDYIYKIRLYTHSLSMGDIHSNVISQFYALDCANRRRKSQPEQDFSQFHRTLNWQTRYRIWREEKVLKLWRKSFQNRNPFHKIYAAVIDPRRAVIRILRFLDR